MLEVGGTFRREQGAYGRSTWLAGCEPADRRAECKADAIEVTGTESGAGQNEQAAHGEELPPRAEEIAAHLDTWWSGRQFFTTCTRWRVKLRYQTSDRRVQVVIAVKQDHIVAVTVI